MTIEMEIGRCHRQDCDIPDKLACTISKEYKAGNGAALDSLWIQHCKWKTCLIV